MLGATLPYTDAAVVVAVLCGCVIASELLVRHTALRHAGVALLVIAVAALVSNVGLIPATAHPVYDGVFEHVAPLAIFWLLLRVNLRKVLSAGLPLLGLFLVGSAGTVVGVLLAMKILGSGAFGEHDGALAGMFAATYTGGSANFNALALHYGVVSMGPIYAGAMAIDAGLTAVWMAATIALPRMLGYRPARGPGGGDDPTPPPTMGPRDADREATAPFDLAMLLGIGLLCSAASGALAQVLAGLGLPVPSILILTTLALALAQLGPVGRLRGSSLLGMFSVYIFLAAIGALCDVSALSDLGALGMRIAVLASVCVLVHAAVIFEVGAACRLDPALAAVASQANIGGGTTALALARSLEREDLVLPAILVGSLGTALGTFLGFWVAALLM